MSNEPIGSPFPTGFSKNHIHDVQPDPEAPLPPPDWRWSWSGWVGIKYGPIPIGLMIALPIIIVRAMSH